MQPADHAPPSGKTALQYGLLFGIIIALIKTGVLATDTFVFYTPATIAVSLGLAALDFLLGVAAYVAVGVLAARQTAKVSTGTLAGLWAGLVYGVVGLIIYMVLFFAVTLPRLLDSTNSTYSAYGSTALSDTFRTGAIITGVGFAIFGVLFTIGLGAGLGALGGLWGRSISKVKEPPPSQPYQAQPDTGAYNPYQSNPYQQYSGQPYPGQEPNPPYYERPH